MKRTLLCGLTLALLAGAAMASEGRSLRTTVRSASNSKLLAQANEINLPAPLSPVPDPSFSQFPASGTTAPAYVPSADAPASSYVPSPIPAYAPAQSYVASAQPVELFQDVRYRATRNIAPCAVPTIVQVPDPCNRDRCCKTCVNVQICVPPCDPQCVKVTRGGDKVKYEYGNYAVTVRTVGRHVVVHYED